MRHGETEWNAGSRLQGQTDIALSARGRRQAAAMAALVRSLEPRQCVVSDLRRTRETAELLGLATPLINPAWREAMLGDWEGKTKTEVGLANYSAWHDGRIDPPGGETMHDLRQRIGSAIAALDCEGTTVVVTHGGVIRTAVSLLIGLTADKIIAVEPGSLTLFEHAGGWRLKAFNVTAQI